MLTNASQIWKLLKITPANQSLRRPNDPIVSVQHGPPAPKLYRAHAAKMQIRLAKLDDLPAMASMAVDAFWNDELFVHTNPWRAQYPDDFRDFFLRRYKRRYWSPDFTNYVAVTDARDEGHCLGGKVVGYASWQRKGTSEEAKAWRRQTWQGCRHTQIVSGGYGGLTVCISVALECLLLNATDKYISFIGADRSLDSGRLARFLSESKVDFDAIPEILKLQHLCVHLAFQRRGVGSMLLDWGKEQAEREGVPIGLESSEKARPMYMHNGFRRYGKMHLTDFPIDDVPIFIWEPKGMEGRWGAEEEREG